MHLQLGAYKAFVCRIQVSEFPIMVRRRGEMSVRWMEFVEARAKALVGGVAGSSLESG
jgi:hypothetical protein